MKVAELIKTDLHTLIDRTEDVSILEAIKTILAKQFVFNKQESDFWDELPEVVKAEINEGLEDIKNGNIYTHQEVMQEMKEERYNIKL